MIKRTLLVPILRNSVHLFQNKKWYPKKRPELQIDILACLVLRGRLSKGQAEAILNKRRHADILKSFRILEEKGLIKKSKNSLFGRGRRQYQYEITSLGIEALINDDFTNSLDFWKIMYGFCHHYNKENDIDQIDRFFDLFFKTYLRYSNRNYLDLHDTFNNMSSLLLEEYSKTSSEISPEQKILEILAINSPLTVNELKDKTKLDINNINKILNIHTIEFFTTNILSDRKIHLFNNTIQKRQNKYYSLFLRHNLIKVKKGKDNIIKYELSLFGIIFVLKLIRYYNIKNKEDYYFNQFTFVNYFEKIVKNYQDRLPMIFEKWNILKKILKDYAIYNFDLIIDLNDSFKENQISVSLGGSKEFYNGIKEIILQTRIQFGDFADLGDYCRTIYLFDATPDPSKEIQNGFYLSKNFPIIKEKEKRLSMFHLISKCYRITKNLNPLEHIQANSLNKIFDPFSKNFEIESIEEMFAEEISAVYYFNLYNKTVLNEENYSLLNNETYKQILNIRPKKCLSQIRMADKEINNFYLKWKNDIIILYQNIFNNINTSFD